MRSARVDIGQTLSRGDRIATLYATDYMEVRLPIADRQLAFLDPALIRSGIAAGSDAAPVSLHAEFGGQRWNWEGRIVRTEGEIDAGSRMVHVVARVENPDAADQAPLPVGLFVQAEIRGQTARGVIRLPRAALRDGDRVLVVDAEDRLRFRPVTLLRADRDTVLVSAGLRGWRARLRLAAATGGGRHAGGARRGRRRRAGVLTRCNASSPGGWTTRWRPTCSCCCSSPAA